jgi:hypothetical protein
LGEPAILRRHCGIVQAYVHNRFRAQILPFL